MGATKQAKQALRGEALKKILQRAERAPGVRWAEEMNRELEATGCGQRIRVAGRGGAFLETGLERVPVHASHAGILLYEVRHAGRHHTCWSLWNTLKNALDYYVAWILDLGDAVVEPWTPDLDKDLRHQSWRPGGWESMTVGEFDYAFYHGHPRLTRTELPGDTRMYNCKIVRVA